MVTASQQNDAKLMIAYRQHFEAGNLEAIALAQSGKLGDLRFFTSEFSQQVADKNVRVTESSSQGGGPLYDMGVYCINAARYLFGAEPVEVLAIAASGQDARFVEGGNGIGYPSLSGRAHRDVHMQLWRIGCQPL